MALECRELETIDFFKVMQLDLKNHDREEAKVVYGVKSEEQLKGLIVQTIAYADESFGIFLGEELIGVYGLTFDEYEDEEGNYSLFYRPWLFTTDKLFSINPITVCRKAKEVVSRWAKEYCPLHNVAMKDEKMKRWLELLGFEVDDEPEDVMFFGMKGEWTLGYD